MRVVTSGHVTKMAATRHTIRSAVSEDPMLQSNFMALCF